MNKQEKEQYLRDYGTLKSQGKPFFPYAVTKDSAMAIVVMAVIIAMSIVLGAELGPKADPTSTTYTPRPEWYFFFLFELLRVIKPPALVPLKATLKVAVPFAGMMVPLAGAPERVKLEEFAPSIVTLLIVRLVAPVFVMVKAFVPAPV